MFESIACFTLNLWSLKLLQLHYSLLVRDTTNCIKIFFIEVKTRRPTMPLSLDNGGMEKKNKHQERCF